DHTRVPGLRRGASQAQDIRQRQPAQAEHPGLEETPARHPGTILTGASDNAKHPDLLAATRPGFEPGQREPKSLVLPLHYRVMDAAYYRIHLLVLYFCRFSIRLNWAVVGLSGRPFV